MKTTGGILTVAALTTALAACGGSGTQSQVTACKHAMRQEFAAAVASGTRGTEPPACKGLPAKTLQKLAGEILTGH